MKRDAKQYSTDDLSTMSNAALKDLAKQQLLTCDFVGTKAKETLLDEIFLRWQSDEIRRKRTSMKTIK